MAEQSQTWFGKNGDAFTFSVVEINAVFKEGYEGNYIFAKKSGNQWFAVYIGEGEFKSRIKAHLDKGCVTRKGATHIHYLVNNNKSQRFKDETNLLERNIEAYTPNGCNEKIGG